MAKANGLSNGRNTWSLTVPRQHGAWSVLLVSFLLGTICQGRISGESLLLFASVLAGFLARHTIALLWRSPRSRHFWPHLLTWAAGYTALALFFGGLLVWGFHRWLLLPLGGIALFFSALSVKLERDRKDRTVMGELVGLVGLCVVIPAAAYVASGLFSEQTWGLWAVGVIFFGGSVFHVRYVVRHRQERQRAWPSRLRAGGSSVAYHLAALAIVLALSRYHVVPLLAPLAFLPVTAKVLWTVGRQQEGRIHISHIGYGELAHTLLFLVLTWLAFHLPQ